MITPAYALTATERVLPRMALDFTTATLDPRITFTRAGNTATRVNASGLIEPVNADVARFDYDSITLASQGLLIEEARTNLLTNSEAFLSWTNYNSPSSLSDTDIAPSGAQTADSIVDNNANDIHGRYKNVVVADGTYTFSAFVKKGTAQGVFLRVRDTPNSGTAHLNIAVDLTTFATIGTTVGTVNVATWKDNYYRISITGAITAGTRAFIIGTVDNNATFYVGTGKSVIVWGAQLEAGAFPTSYIPTTTTALTRNADVATMTGTNFSDWYNQTQGTIQVEVFENVSATNVFAHLFAISDGTTNNAIGCYNYGGNFSSLSVRSGAVQQAGITGAEIKGSAGLLRKITAGVKLNDIGYAVAGNAVSTDTSATMPVSVNILRIGGPASGAGLWNGTIAKLNYWPQKLTSNELQSFSK
jgi:hypothetical protein